MRWFLITATVAAVWTYALYLLATDGRSQPMSARILLARVGRVRLSHLLPWIVLPEMELDGHRVRNAAVRIDGAMHKAGQRIGDVAHKAGQKVHAAGDRARRRAHQVGEKVKDGAETIGDALDKGVAAVRRGAAKVRRGMAKVGAATGTAIGGALEKTGGRMVRTGHKMTVRALHGESADGTVGDEAMHFGHVDLNEYLSGKTNGSEQPEGEAGAQGDMPEAQGNAPDNGIYEAGRKQVEDARSMWAEDKARAVGERPAPAVSASA